MPRSYIFPGPAVRYDASSRFQSNLSFQTIWKPLSLEKIVQLLVATSLGKASHDARRMVSGTTCLHHAQLLVGPRIHRARANKAAKSQRVQLRGRALTLLHLTWTPRLLCVPEHWMQRNVPWLTGITDEEELHEERTIIPEAH